MPGERSHSADLVLLHTAGSHVETFEALLESAAPKLTRRHVVAADLLARAEKEGLCAGLKADLRGALAEIARAQPGLLLCTCSTLGGLAEEFGQEIGLDVLRLDRALADAALDAGERILVMAAVPTTLAPTRELLEDLATERQRKVQITLHLVAGAWSHFMAGEMAQYHDTVAQAARRQARDCDVVILAQASMAPAADLLSDLGTPVLASPRLGIEMALSRLMARAT